MKQLKEDSIVVDTDISTLDYMINKLTEVRNRIKSVWNVDDSTVGISYDGEITVYFKRMETDYEYNHRTQMEQSTINRELAELKRLKAKYEDK